MRKLLLPILALILCLGCFEKDPVKFGGTFLDVLNKATEMVKAECPDAVLYEGDAMNLKDSAMTAEDIPNWQFVYWIEDDKTAIIQYADSIFSNVSIIPYPTLEDVLIKAVDMDLVEAIDLMRKANYSDVIAAANLRWPLYPGCDEPYYIFGCPSIGHVFVGVNSKKVTVEPFGHKLSK